MKPKNPRLTVGQLVVVVLLAGPPLVLVLFNVGPGRWMNAVQDAVIGGHSLELSILAVLILESVLLWVVGVGVRWLTGRTVVELFTRKKSDDSEPVA
jgi:hypothetical protein